MGEVQKKKWKSGWRTGNAAIEIYRDVLSESHFSAMSLLLSESHLACGYCLNTTNADFNNYSIITICFTPVTLHVLDNLLCLSFCIVMQMCNRTF